MSTQPEDTLTFPVVAEDTPVTETLEALPAVTGTAPAPERPWHLYPIGDWLISSLPGFDTLPCGHCGAVFGGATPGVLTEVRVLGRLRHLAYEAGWEYDLGLMWTCPQCRQDAAQAAAEAAVLLAGGSYPDILRDYDLAARATMTASGRYSWDYDDWRGTWQPRPERCMPEPAAEQRAA